jgi:hypothetical protein
MWFLLESDAWLRWRARRLPTTPLDRVGGGVRVKVVGRLEAGKQPLEAPISGRATAAWAVELQAGSNLGTIVVERQAQDFVLRDGSRRTAIVRAAGASVAFATHAWMSPAQPSERMLAFLRRHRQPESGDPGAPSPYRYRESVLEPGEAITVVGLAHLEIEPSESAGSYREPPLRVVIGAAPNAPLWILDSPRIGVPE